MTKPDFPGKLSIFFYEQFFKKSVFGHFLENASLVSAEIAYLDSSEKLIFTHFWTFFISNFSKNQVFGHFLENAALVMAKIAYSNSSHHCLQLLY